MRHPRFGPRARRLYPSAPNQPIPITISLYSHFKAPLHTGLVLSYRTK